MADHVHRFEPIISRPPHLQGFEIPVGYKPCVCGKTRTQVFMERYADPFANARRAAAMLRARGWPAWKGSAWRS
jgi:hypothetical protein